MPLAVAATATATPAPAATATASAEAIACKPETAVPKPAQTAAFSLQESMDRQNELMKDPEYRKLRVAQQRLSIERSYPGLAEALGLSEKEADKLFDLLTESQVAMSAETQLSIVNGTPDQAAMQERMKRQQAMQREQEESVRAMLGSKYTQWQDYQQTRPARSRVTSMNSQLAQAGMPMTDAQTRALTTVMISEQQRQRQEAQTMARPAGNPTDPDYRAKMMEESLKRTEENNLRTVEAAAPHLSAKQLAALREQMEQQTAMTRISMRMQAEQERLRTQSQQK
ncbi:MAG: hypothetical protein ABI645_03875 [Pseudomonadota bacterium]